MVLGILNDAIVVSSVILQERSLKGVVVEKDMHIQAVTRAIVSETFICTPYSRLLNDNTLS